MNLFPTSKCVSVSTLWLIYGSDSMGNEFSVIFFLTLRSYFLQLKESGSNRGSSRACIHVIGIWFIATLLPNDSTIERLRLEREAPITSKRYLWQCNISSILDDCETMLTQVHKHAKRQDRRQAGLINFTLE